MGQIIDKDWLKQLYEILPEEQKKNVTSGRMADLTRWVDANRGLSVFEGVNRTSNNIAVKLIMTFHRISVEFEKTETEKQDDFSDASLDDQMSFADFPYLYPERG